MGYEGAELQKELRHFEGKLLFYAVFSALFAVIIIFGLQLFPTTILIQTKQCTRTL